MHEKNKFFIKIAVIILLSYLLCSSVLTFLSGIENYSMNLLDDQISSTVIRKDGTIEAGNGNHFPMLNRGDIVTADIHLPLEYYAKDTDICFYMYHCGIRLYYKDQLLYSYGNDKLAEGKHIGGIYPVVTIPEDAWGNDLTLKCICGEDGGTSRIRNMTILPAKQASKYFFLGQLPVFLVFCALHFISLLAVFSLIFFGFRKNLLLREAMYLAIFCNLFSCYILSFYGMFNVLYGNQEINANLEYLSLFLLPTPLCAFFWEHISNRVGKRIFKIFTQINFIYFVACTILNYNTKNFHFSRMIPLLHIFFLIDLFVIIYFGLKVIVKQENGVIVKRCLELACVLFCVELIRFNIDKYLMNRNSVLSHSILHIAMLVFISGLLFSMFQQLAGSYMNAREKERLQELAYVDILTGLANRTRCQERINEIAATKQQEFGIIFFDVNNLKAINDGYSHQMGDDYIRAVADSMKTAFEQSFVCGRIGGDEFIVILCENEIFEIENRLKLFDWKISEINKAGTFPIPLVVARGVAISTKENPLEIKNVIEQADEYMYVYKENCKILGKAAGA